MGYKKATHVLPQHLLRAIQEYVDGEYLYIPVRKKTESSGARLLPTVRNGLPETAKWPRAARRAGLCRNWRSGIFFLKKRCTKFLQLAGKLTGHADAVPC